jgi:hypothetical protein
MMTAASGTATAWAAVGPWFVPRIAPVVFALSGIDSSAIVEAAPRS